MYVSYPRNFTKEEQRRSRGGCVGSREGLFSFKAGAIMLEAYGYSLVKRDKKE